MRRVLPLHALFSLSLIGEVQVPEGYPNRSDAVIYVEKASLPPPKAMTAVIGQKDMTFAPHVTVVTRSSTLRFDNFDPSIHGIKSSDGPLKKLHYVMTPKQKRKFFKVTETGVSEILCDMHVQMNAFVLVVDNPYFAISDSSGKFSIKKLPEPPFTIKAWHPVLPLQSFKIENAEDLKGLSKIVFKAWSN